MVDDACWKMLSMLCRSHRLCLVLFHLAISKLPHSMLGFESFGVVSLFTILAGGIVWMNVGGLWL